MVKSVLILSGSPKKDGNTAILVDWFAEGARSKGAEVEIVHIGAPRFKASGCMACRACQSSKKYECVIPDDATPLLARMPDKDVIVMASPLYFYGASAQLKAVFDRFFSLYKWDNLAGTMETPLKGKTLVFIGSGFEDVGMDIFAKPFELTASYTGMKFASLLVPNAGVSGEIKAKAGIREKAIAFGSEVADGH